MTHSTAELAGRIRTSVRQWFHNRLQECVHCWQCHSLVMPWDSHCDRCGQENPARVSPSAAVYLVLAFGLLAIGLSALVFAF